MELCSDWMIHNLDRTLCFSFMFLAEKYNLDRVSSETNQFLLRNFPEMCKLKEFISMSKTSLSRCLSSDELFTNADEELVFFAVIGWLEHEKSRLEHLVELISQIRFGFIEPERLTSETIGRHKLIDDNKECRNFIMEALHYHSNVYAQPFYSGNLNRPRGARGLVLIPPGDRIGEGYSIEGDTTDVHLCSINGGEPRKHFVTVMETPCIFGR